MKHTSRIYATQFLDRIVAVLAAFEDGETELRLTDLTRKTQLHKSTLYRLLRDVGAWGWSVDDRAATTKFRSTIPPPPPPG